MMNFEKLTIEFTYNNKRHLLHGKTPRIKTVDVKSLDKMVKRDAQLFMIKILDPESHNCGTVLSGVEMDPEMESLIQEFDGLFVDPKGLPPHRDQFDHKIPLACRSNPIYMRPYRYSSTQKDIIDELVLEMLEQGIVQPSSSPYASPVVLVGKKDGSWRLCVDYRALNKITIKDKFPILIIEELLEELGGSRVYSKLDLRSGYHQIRMHPTDVEKTALKTHAVYYEYLVIPFVLTNAPSSF